MTLKDYLNQNKLSLKVFGDLCGLSAPTILRARDGTNDNPIFEPLAAQEYFH